MTLTVDFRSLKENVDTTTSSGKLVLTIFAALSEFERSIIRERAAEGIAIAKAKEKKLGRREIQIDDDKLISLYNQWKDGEILQKKIMKDCRMSRTTLHKHITRLKKEGIMKTKDYLAYIVNEIHTTIVATVDDEGLPVTAAIDMMDYDDNSLYFVSVKASYGI